MRYQRNPSIDWKAYRPVAYLGIGYVAYKMAQGGAFGLPLQTVTKGLGAAGSQIATATSAAIEYGYGAKPAATPQGPNTGDGSAATGPQRAIDTKGTLLPSPVDLSAYDPAVRGFAWDGRSVYTIGSASEQSVLVGQASTQADALGAARRWFTG